MSCDASFAKSLLASSATVPPATVLSEIVVNGKFGLTVERQLSLPELFGFELLAAAQASTGSNPTAKSVVTSFGVESRLSSACSGPVMLLPV